MNQRGEVVEKEKSGRGVREGGAEKVSVSSEEGEAVERTAGEVVCCFAAELLGEHAGWVFVEEDGEGGRWHFFGCRGGEDCFMKRKR